LTHTKSTAAEKLQYCYQNVPLLGKSTTVDQ